MPLKKNIVKKKSRYKLFQENISKNSKFINTPALGINNMNGNVSERISIDMNTNLNANMTKFKTKIIKKTFPLKHDILKNDAIKTIKYKLLPTKEQEIVFQKWFSAYIEMYNLIIKKIKNKFKAILLLDRNSKLIDLNIDLNITKLKKEFSENKVILNKKYNINMHILDYAIVDAVAMYKSKISNLKNGHIKKSHLRYLKHTKGTKIFKIEKFLCNDNAFCVSQLGSFIKTCPPINFKTETELVGIVQYNKQKNEYSFLVRKRIFSENQEYDIHYTKQKQLYDNILTTSNEYLNFMKTIDKTADNSCVKNLNREINLNKRKLNNKRIYDNEESYQMKQPKHTDILSIDPGIRTFITGISNDHIKEIGTNMSGIIKTKLIRLDSIANNKNLNKQKQNKLLLRTRFKLKNTIDDYHWKIINHLMDNYRHILIGNFSTKEMGEGIQLKMTKRIGNSMRFYVFKNRLQYKCYLNGIKYTEIDEYCTSKCCSACGNYKSNLGQNKIYNCTKCGLVIDRDVNAAVNILIKGIK